MNDFLKFITESPDSTTYGGKIVDWQQPIAVAFIISPSFYAILPRNTHGIILRNLHKLTTIKNTFTFPEEITFQKMRLKGNFENIKHIISKREENRSVLLRYSNAHTENIIVGRIWPEKRIISMWNNINDVSLKVIEEIQNVLNFNGDQFIWELFEKSDDNPQPKEVQYSLDELEDKLLQGNKSNDFDYQGETLPTTNNIPNPQWDKLHLTTPDKKAQALKDLGIKPKKPMNIKDRFNAYQEQTLLEMPQQISAIPSIETDINKIKKLNLIDNIKLNNIPFEIYSDNFSYYFIHNNIIAAELEYFPFGNGIKESLIIQHPKYKGLARMIYTNYLLKKYAFILSDTSMTIQGLNFWIKLWKDLHQHYTFYIFNKKENKKIPIKNENMMRKSFDKNNNNHSYQFVVVNK